MALNCDMAALSIKHRLNRNFAHPHNFAAVLHTSLCDHTGQKPRATAWPGYRAIPCTSRCIRIDGGSPRPSIPPPATIGTGASGLSRRLAAGPRPRSAQSGAAHHPAARTGPSGSPRGHSATATPRTRAPSRRRSGREAPRDPARPAEQRSRIGRVRHLTGCQ